MKSTYKSTLKSGMIVELRNGTKYLVVEDYLIGYLSHMCLSRYNEDLTYSHDYQDNHTLQTNKTIEKLCSIYDIMKVWEQKDMSNLASMLEDTKNDSWVDRFGELIYNRTNRLEEIQKQLKETAQELFIYDRAYVAEREEALDKWNNLIGIINREKLNINWRDYLPHYNCEGETLW